MHAGVAVIDAILKAVTDNTCDVISVSFGLCGLPASYFTGTVSPIYQKAAAQGQTIFISSRPGRRRDRVRPHGGELRGGHHP
jgi:hypothetical protein